MKGIARIVSLIAVMFLVDWIGLKETLAIIVLIGCSHIELGRDEVD